MKDSPGISGLAYRFGKTSILRGQHEHAVDTSGAESRRDPEMFCDALAVGVAQSDCSEVLVGALARLTIFPG